MNIWSKFKTWIKRVFSKRELTFREKLLTDETFRRNLAADYIEQVLKTTYGVSMPFMCPLLWNANVPVPKEDYVAAVLMVRKTVHERIDNHGTLHAYLSVTQDMTTSSSMDREFTSRYGRPFYKNFIKELRGQNEPD